VIAAPDGQEAARAGDTPQVIYADLDPENVSWAQDRVPYLSEMDSLRLK
jgi:predicted amidohydrolase